MFAVENSIVQELKTNEWASRGIRVLVKRDDLIHPLVSGNKWRKLKYNIAMCRDRKNERILTFGGAFSNHLVATAAACAQEGIKCIGIVRGDELNETSNATLSNCAELGMELIFVTREEYAMRNEKSYQDQMAYDYPNSYIVPEGGANYYGIVGCQEIIKEVQEDFDHVFVSQGTCTTSCGILSALKGTQQLHVVPALKGYDSEQEMKSLFRRSGMVDEWVDEQYDRVQAHPEFHFGGYGKYTEELLNFVRSFYGEHGIKLDPIYTGKTMFALMQELQSERYNNTTTLFIHTGGIQGAVGVERKIGYSLYE